MKQMDFMELYNTIWASKHLRSISIVSRVPSKKRNQHAILYNNLTYQMKGVRV